MAQTQQWQTIPTHLTLAQFEEFVLPHLHLSSRGPQPKLSLHTIFNYILKLLYLGCQLKARISAGVRRSTRICKQVAASVGVVVLRICSMIG